jgi:hypothetical protein
MRRATIANFGEEIAINIQRTRVDHFEIVSLDKAAPL